MFCRSLFVLLYFIFCPLWCLFFFDIRILITSLQTLLIRKGLVATCLGGSLLTRRCLGGSLLTRRFLGGSLLTRRFLGGSLLTRRCLGGSLLTRRFLGGSLLTRRFLGGSLLTRRFRAFLIKGENTPYITIEYILQ